MLGMDLLPIQAATVERIHEVIRGAMGSRLNSGLLADFLAMVDWSHSETADPTVCDLLGTMEQWDTEFAERDISEAEYTARLRSVLSGAYPLAV
jgi:hypothetical protein